MEQHEYATGAGEVPGGGAGGRGVGAGQLTADAGADVPAATAAVPATGARAGVAADPRTERLAEQLAAAEAGVAHDLFAAAFGLYGARHFGGVLDAEQAASAGTSWWHGPSVQHPASLRSREGWPVRGQRRARRIAAAALPPARSSTRGRHRKPERSPGSTPHEIAVERRTAARLLVAHPLVTAAGPHGAGFPLIHRHADWLAERFLAVLGYPLTIGHSYARLHKAGLPGRGLPGFGPAGYACLVRALAALADGQPAAAGEPAVRQLLDDWQVLTCGEDGRPVVDRELARALGPLAAPPADGPALAVRRRLAETPVVLLDELGAEERSWLLEHQQAEAELFADFLGLEAEIRAEGVALLDPADELTDLALPGTGALAQAALLLVERLVEDLRPLPEESAPPAVLIPDALIDGALGDITDEYGLAAGWHRDYLADLAGFRRDALDLLHRMQLIAPAGRAWLLRAPAARYAPPLELHPAQGSGRHSRPGPVTAAPLMA
ncbi:DUF2398 family protein [Kitasatospora sp. GP82]|uniref:DUF2398 family protein n=1 Tax=Kitasatospora sp. GP82 TaxID=3035089 RepID=UPI002473F7C5|nr:DUF2398 family protein [Kitasatospora sp. GP82]MDH6128419.1 hypothetical protein [Kitasatospora sp. GP82]